MTSNYQDDIGPADPNLPPDYDLGGLPENLDDNYLEGIKKMYRTNKHSEGSGDFSFEDFL